MRLFKPMLVVLLLMSTPCLAVRTSFWTHSSEEDFREGTFESVVATNYGDLKLSRAVQVLLDEDPRITAVYALAEAPDGTIYAATGPEGVLLRISDGEVSTARVLGRGVNVFSLLIDRQGRLLLGTGGERGRVLRIEQGADEPQVLFESPAVQYVWAMQQSNDGVIYAATGPNGQLVAISPEGDAKLLLDSTESNLLSMAYGGGDLLYVGSDPNGRVYRVNRRSGEVFVLYEAAESEISALVLDRAGNLYAATGQPTETGMMQMGPPMPGQGRPEVGAHGPATIDSPLPPDPSPPQRPEPGPDEPPAIPHVPAVPGPARDDGDSGNDIGEPADDADDPAADPDDAHELPPGLFPGQQPGLPGMMPGVGNAIYRIDRNGFVTEIFREGVIVHSMILQDRLLLVGTGPEGLVYQVDPAAEETLVVANVEPQQITALLPATDGGIYMGMANVGGIGRMTAGFADRGVYLSPVLDAVQISQFGRIQLHGQLPQRASLHVSTRSGNTAEPGEIGWSDWSEPVAATRFVQVQSPPARFLQYRLTFASQGGAESPVVDEVRVAYQVPNLAPQIRAVMVGNGNPMPGGDGQRGTGSIAISWQAVDPNDDPLEYTLHFRSAPGRPWILLEERLTESSFEWDTRAVADGRYQIRVTASDARANPLGMGKTATRVTDPIIVDNTPPVIGDVAWNRVDEGVQIELVVVDRTSHVAAVDYSVNSAADWQAVLPVDKIFDSQEEQVRFVIPGLGPGPHQVTIRATDARGNQAFETILLR